MSAPQARRPWSLAGVPLRMPLVLVAIGVVLGAVLAFTLAVAVVTVAGLALVALVAFLLLRRRRS